MAVFAKGLANALLNEIYTDKAERINQARLQRKLQGQKDILDYQDTITDENIADERKYTKDVVWRREDEIAADKAEAEQTKALIDNVLSGRLKGKGGKTVGGYATDILAGGRDLTGLGLKPDPNKMYYQYLMSKAKKDTPEIRALQNKLSTFLQAYTEARFGNETGQVDWDKISFFQEEYNKAADKLKKMGIEVSPLGVLSQNVPLPVNVPDPILDPQAEGFNENTQQIINAMGKKFAGGKGNELIDKYPNEADAIEEAFYNGYSPEEIERFLMKKYGNAEGN